MSKPTPDNGADADQDNEMQAQDQTETSISGEEALDGSKEQGSEESVSPEDLSMEQALEKLAEAELAAVNAKDDLLRVQAEMQNLRRRTEQDIEKAHKYGQEKLDRKSTRLNSSH